MKLRLLFPLCRYIESILRDVKWIGGDWGSHLYYASDYFQQLYDWAEELIKKDLAFVDFDSLEEIRRKRGSITEPGENSPYRSKFTVEENLAHFRKYVFTLPVDSHELQKHRGNYTQRGSGDAFRRRMRDGEYEEGQCVLRAKIDMTHKNVIMRDPIMYRILKKEHPRTGRPSLQLPDSLSQAKLSCNWTDAW